MDPSEFEGTVEREEGALDAGALETLLEPRLKFHRLDLSKEIGDLHLSIYTLKESLTKYEELSIDSLAQEMGDQTVKLSGMRDEYLTRRKVLTAQVKAFSQEFLGNGQNSPDPIISRCRELISSFKIEFDFLASLAKLSEAAFVASYQALKDMPDPASVVSDSLEVSLKAHEGLSSAQEQLNIADEIINETGSKHGGQTASSTALAAKLEAEIAVMKQHEEKNNEELKQSYLNEISNLRSKFDLDMRTKELNLTNTFEMQQLELQQQFESTLSKRDAELASVMHSLQELQQRDLESEARAGALDSEIAKRRELEEKWRAAMLQASELDSANQDLSSRLEKATAGLARMGEEAESERREVDKEQRAQRQRLQELSARLEAATEALHSRPPADLSQLLENIGGSLGSGSSTSELHSRLLQQVSHSTAASNADGGSNTGLDNEVNVSGRGISWSEVEVLLIESFRKCDADATSSRVKLHEATQHVAQLQRECDRQAEQLAKQTTLVASLEADLLRAHRALEASNATLKKLQSQQRGFTFRKRKPLGEVDADAECSMDGGGCGDGDGGVSRLSSEQLETLLDLSDYTLDTVHQHDAIGVTNMAAPNNSHDNLNNVAVHHSDRQQQQEEEEGQNTSILQAVQNQRDRYMRALRETESELLRVKDKFDRQQDEQIQLRNENLELYRRLRVLRVSASSSGSNSSSNSNSSGSRGGRGGVVRSRKAIASELIDSASFNDTLEEGGSGRAAAIAGSGGSSSGWDALDSKYMGLYEAEISPFNVEEMDKQVCDAANRLSKCMNIPSLSSCLP